MKPMVSSMDDEEKSLGGGSLKPTGRCVESFWTIFRKAVFIKNKIPLLRDIHFNFIFFHYMYILSWTIIGSVIIYPGGPLRYIDSLFFASGAATQSGLNTVDFNRLHTYQQVVLYFISMLSTPIFINSCLVFIRLYWFEKRFEHVVNEAKAVRRTRTKAATFTSKDEPDLDREEREAGDQPIVVLRSDTGDARGKELNHPVVRAPDEANSNKDSTDGNNRQDLENREDKEGDASDNRFRMGLGSLRVPTQLSPEHHIAFLEKQRKNKGALRIPSPREYDRGGGPQTLEEEGQEDQEGEKENWEGDGKGDGDDNGDSDTQADILGSDQANESDIRDNLSPHDNQRIAFNEPEITKSRTRGSTFARGDARGSARDNTARFLPRPRHMKRIRESLTQEKDRNTLPYLSWNATVGRNSRFIDLTEEQRNELGGIEYRALKTLAVLLITYYVFFHSFGIISLVGWIMCNDKWGSIVEQNGQGRPWWGIFTSASALNDVGFTLTPDSMDSFQTAVWPLLLMAFLIIIGNTAFPCMLRLIIWVSSKVVVRGSGLWEELRFLLDHPRRCFTLLFPRNATWWLFATLVLLNVVDLIFFIILDINDEAVTDIAPGYRVLVGLFQAASTRTAGFQAVSISDLHPAIQVSYLVMMYISVFPIAISLRRTNVYEEKSLGIYPAEDDEDPDSDETKNAPSYIQTHLRKQLGFDLWFVFLGLFIIAIAEGGSLRNSAKPAFELFSVLFEVVSAYGTVGLSLGYPNVNTSFCSQFNVISKLIIIAMQIRGRHRGLPYALDRAILLPSEHLHQNEMADAEARTRRRASTASNLSFQRTRTAMQPQPQQQQQQQQQDTGLSTGMDVQDYAMNDRVPAMRRQSTLRS